MTVSSARLSNETAVIVVTVHGFTPRVSGVQLPQLRGVAGQTVAVVVAGEAIVGAVPALGSTLPLL